MALSNTTFDGRLSATINKWLSANYESLFLENNALFTKLQANGRIVTDGFGISMVEPIRFPAGGGVSATGLTSTTVYTAITHTDMTGFSAANYTAAEYYIPVSIQDYYLNEQGSDTSKVDFAQGNLEQAMDIVLSKLNYDMWVAEETTGAGGGRATLASIRAFMNAGTATTTDGSLSPSCRAEQTGNRAVAGATSSTPVYTIGGINRNAASAGYWCVPIINTSQTLTIQVLSGIVSKATVGKNSPDLLICHEDSLDKIMSLASLAGSNGGQQFTNSKLADIGFNAVRFRGADLVSDERVPTAVYLNATTTTYGYNLFALNTRFLKLRTKSMKPQLTAVPDARALHVWKGTWYGQLTASNLGRVHSRHVYLTN